MSDSFGVARGCVVKCLEWIKGFNKTQSVLFGNVLYKIFIFSETVVDFDTLSRSYSVEVRDHSAFLKHRHQFEVHVS